MLTTMPHQRPLGRDQAAGRTRRSLLALTSLAIVLGACSGDDETDGLAPLEPQQGELEALTYNVAGLPQGISSSNPVEYTPLISPLLNAYDLVLAQEDFVYHAELSKDAQHPYQSVPKEDYAMLVHDGLNRFSEFPWLSFTRVQWVSCYGDASTGASDCMAEKGFSLARTVFGNGVTFDVYNHHAEAGSGPEDLEARAAGYDQLIAFMQEHSAGHVVILGGDTNLHGDDVEDQPILQKLEAQTGLEDACTVLDCSDDRIDRFYFRPSDIIHLEPVAWRVPPEFVDSQGNDLSDHKPVHVTFAWHTK